MKQRSYEKEMMDKDNIPASDMFPIMKELNVINTLLGGHRITCRGIDFFLSKVPAGRQLTIAEIGCGGGDNLSTLDKHLKKKDVRPSLIGIDIQPECIAFAQQRGSKETTWICSDYKEVTWPGERPDIIFSSLFCHHFTDDQLIGQLQWLRANSRIGFFINDLHRHPVAYNSIKFITRLFSGLQLVKNDAPLSVKRAFKRKEWVNLLSGAGIAEYNLRWYWAFRYLICAQHG